MSVLKWLLRECFHLAWTRTQHSISHDLTSVIMIIIPAEKSIINQHELHVVPDWFMLFRAGIVLVLLVDLHSHAVLKRNCSRSTSNQPPLLVPACKTFLKLVTSNAG